ncbi:uncharacterized protein LOC126586777 isoform X1 [Malus sylvestris]|uniref:uncharacterized protein LOC126586777 isoform X1 n=1 Tax=Malus sylvestris TaxID=3752 RepID=UPI0021AD046C|nr:uncharacterized protein LOC126586777 isoform X1 [Malus sylvestris]
MILFGFCVFFRYGSNVLDGQERISSGVDECDEAGAGDEVDRAGGYGGMKVEADKDESSTYAVMLASDVPQRWETRCIIFCMDTTTCTLWMQCDLFFLLKLPLLILSLLFSILSV